MPTAFPAADDIRSAMDAVREVSSVANALRKKEGKRVRLPLARLTVVLPDAASLAQFEGILRDELNVKSVELVELEADTAVAYGITSRLSVNARAAGPRLGKRVQQVIQAAKAGTWTESDGVVTVQTADGEIALEAGEYELVLETTGRPEGEALALLAAGGFVLLDTADDARARGRGARARRDPRGAGHAQGGGLRRERPHPPAAAVQQPRGRGCRLRRRSTRPMSRARRSRSSTRCW